MEFLNLSWLEIAFVLILAFIVLGPEKLVKTSKDLGSWFRKLSRDQLFRDVVQTTDEIRRYPRKIFDESLLDLPAHVEKQINEPLQEMGEGVIIDQSTENEQPE